ncbi:YeeE/YedE family protein [Epibacterium sp. DP7N7-1]|nr:YeeE/YedE family protein [Epibacterium sp. DP7N7-1]
MAHGTWHMAVSLLMALLLLRYMIAGQKLRAYLRLTVVMAGVGTSFVALGYLHQPFPWVSALSHLPPVKFASTASTLALMAGATIHAAMTGQLRFVQPTARGSTRRLLGGGLMGLGIVLVPGGNDGVLLYGMPAGEPKAFVAYIVMVGTIAVAIFITGRVTEAWKKRRP